MKLKREFLLEKKMLMSPLIEVGGTVGDIESLPFLEAIRQFAAEVGRANCLFIHVTLVPYIACSNEQKTKPTQHSVKELLGLRIQPDVIVLRSEQPVGEEQKKKIALFCNVREDCVIENLDLPLLYMRCLWPCGRKGWMILYAAISVWIPMARIWGMDFHGGYGHELKIRSNGCSSWKIH